MGLAYSNSKLEASNDNFKELTPEQQDLENQVDQDLKDFRDLRFKNTIDSGNSFKEVQILSSEQLRSLLRKHLDISEIEITQRVFRIMVQLELERDEILELELRDAILIESFKERFRTYDLLGLRKQLKL